VPRHRATISGQIRRIVDRDVTAWGQLDLDLPVGLHDVLLQHVGGESCVCVDRQRNRSHCVQRKPDLVDSGLGRDSTDLRLSVGDTFIAGNRERLKIVRRQTIDVLESIDRIGGAGRVPCSGETIQLGNDLRPRLSDQGLQLGQVARLI